MIDEHPAPIQKVSIIIPAKTESIPSTSNTSVNQAKPVLQHKENPKENTDENKPVFKRPGSISISASNTVSTPQVSYSEKKQEEKVTLTNPFTFEELERVWQQFAETIPKQGRMTSFILSTSPKLVSDTTFELTVSNILQEKELKRLQPDILEFMHQKLQNSSITMTLRIEEETAVQRANSPEDRYRIMADQNPALDKLKNALGLEID